MKVKIIKSMYYDVYDDYNQHSAIFPVSTDWEEIDEKDFAELLEAVSYANMRVNGRERYILVSYHDEMFDEVYRYASDFKENVRKEKEKEEKEKTLLAEKRKASALVRKKKQLEKLKKELGES